MYDLRDYKLISNEIKAFSFNLKLKFEVICKRKYLKSRKTNKIKYIFIISLLKNFLNQLIKYFMVRFG